MIPEYPPTPNAVSDSEKDISELEYEIFNDLNSFFGF